MDNGPAEGDASLSTQFNRIFRFLWGEEEGNEDSLTKWVCHHFLLLLPRILHRNNTQQATPSHTHDMTSNVILFGAIVTLLLLLFFHHITSSYACERCDGVFD